MQEAAHSRLMAAGSLWVLQNPKIHIPKRGRKLTPPKFQKVLQKDLQTIRVNDYMVMTRALLELLRVVLPPSQWRNERAFITDGLKASRIFLYQKILSYNC